MAKQKIAKEVLETTAELSRKAYDEILDYFGYGADAEEISAEIDNLTPQTRRLIRALEREDYLGFDTPDQALKQFIEDPVQTIENYDVSPQLKGALTRFANDLPSKAKKTIDDVDPRIGASGALASGSLLAALTSGYSEDADAMLNKSMLEKALRVGIDEFTPPGGANLHTGLFDRGEGTKAQDNLFAVMTAENPNAQALPDAENIERTRQFGLDLIDRYGEDNVTLVKGMYDNPERSFIIDNQSPLEIARLGKEQGQESVFTNQGLILTSGDDIGYMHPIQPQILPHTKSKDWRGVIDPDATNYYTEARSDGMPQYGIPGRTEKIRYDIDWGNKIRIPSIDEPLIPASAKGVHYSTTQGLSELDPGYYGTGAAGAEKARVEAGAPARTMFYLGDEELVPESVVRSIAPNRYNARLENMYDAVTDPQGVREFSSWDTEFEKNLQALGYDGYLSSSMADPKAGRTGTGVKFTPTEVAAAATAATAATAAKAEEGPGSAAFNERLDRAKYERALADVAQIQDLTEYRSPYDMAKRYPGGPVGSIEAPNSSYRELLARGGDALQNLEYPIVGEPFSATGNILHDMAYGDSPEVMDAVFAPLEMFGVVSAPLKYGLLNAYGADDIARAGLLEMLVKQGGR